MDEPSGRYTISIQGDRLIFRTSSFRAEKESVLHKGVYTKEFSSMLFASGVCILFYMAVAFLTGVRLVHHLVAVTIFVLSFLGARQWLFRDRSLEVVFDRAHGMVRISYPGFFRRQESIPMGEIASVEMGSRRFVPQNIDGIEFVERISAQHGSPVPGLRDEEEFVTLVLRLRDGTERIIYAQRVEARVGGEPYIPLREIREFLREVRCQKGRI